MDGNGFPVGWGQSTQGGSAYFNASSGVLNFYRTGAVTQAVVLQYTGLALGQHAPLELTFKLGNTWRRDGWLDPERRIIRRLSS